MLFYCTAAEVSPNLKKEDAKLSSECAAGDIYFDVRTRDLTCFTFAYVSKNASLLFFFSVIIFT